jgi:hypothetical protein
MLIKLVLLLLLVATPAQAQLSATFLGQTGEDKVGQMDQVTPNGTPDYHIRLSGARMAIVGARISGNQTGLWITPYAGNWIILIEGNDLWFDYYPDPGTLTVLVTYSDGTTESAVASPPLSPPTNPIVNITSCRRTNTWTQACPLTLSWTHSVSDGTNAPNYYIVERRTAPDMTFSQSGFVLANINSLDMVIISDPGNTQYFYRVYAVNAVGSSGPSPEVGGQTNSTIDANIVQPPTMPGYVRCAGENENCNFNGVGFIAYGNTENLPNENVGNWMYGGTYGSPVACTAANFGGPPSTLPKECYVMTFFESTPTPTAPTAPTGFTIQ